MGHSCLVYSHACVLLVKLRAPSPARVSDPALLT